MSTASKDPAAATLAVKRALVAERLRKGLGKRQAPLSFAQQRLWFLDQLEANSPLYNIATLARISGNLNVPAFEQSLNAVVARHEALRTRFVCVDETPMQIIEPRVNLQLSYRDLAAMTEAEQEGKCRQLTHEEVNRPFDLGSAPLLRATLVRLRPNEFRLILIIHHIVADEWSLRILFREWSEDYRQRVGGVPALWAPLRIQYADYAVWQRDWLRGELLAQQVEYWKSRLAGALQTELPPDYPRGPAAGFQGGTETRPFGEILSDQLAAFAREQQATLFMVLLAAFNALVHRYTQQEDITIGSPIAGRSRVETEDLIGFFVNTLPLRTSVAGDPEFTELLRRVRETTIGAYGHQDLPFDKLVQELRPERSDSHLAFTRLMFVLQNRGPEALSLPGARIEFLEAEAETAKFDLTLSVQETTRGLVAKAEYNRGLFDGMTIRRLLEHFEIILRGIIAAPSQRVSQLPIIAEAERRQLLREWTDTRTNYPRDKCVHVLFEEQAAASPDATAVVYGQQSITYGELNARANQLAGYLKHFNVAEGVPVGICLEASLEFIIAMLAVLKAGGAYVPLDVTYPKERLGFMLADTQTPVLLTHQQLLAEFPRDLVRAVCLDAEWELIARECRENPPNPCKPDSLAYIMYTSGSTGQPKGANVTHRGINRLVLSTDYVQLERSDRMAQVSNVSFDAATFEVWGALLNGARLVGIAKDVLLSPRSFAQALRDEGITTMFLTAALFNQVAAEAPEAFAALRTLIAGGDALDPKWVRRVLQQGPPGRLLNGYGPTENTTFTCCGLVREVPESATQVPIGRPIANTQVYLLDRHLNPVPIGVPGELYAGGDGVAHGYWNRPELTAEKSLPDPFNPNGSARLYRTGDLAKYLPDGNIVFLGRIDQQVKIRGFRVELGEIETVLHNHPDIKECVVVVTGSGARHKKLVAYVVPGRSPGPNASELRDFLAHKLPDYMVPSTFVTLNKLPLNPNGKVDRKALPEPDAGRPELEKQYTPPRDHVERRLTEIWQTVLEVKPIGIRDRFFDLGGHSLLAVRLVAQIEKAFGKKLRLATIFQAPTIEQLAAVVREEIKETSLAHETSIVEIHAQGARPPLYLVHGAGGGMFWGYSNLARHLGTDQPVYAFKSRGLDGREEFARIEQIASQYVTDLRRVHPHGPYYLGGYCFGGNVAFEMARQLEQQGEAVAFLALLNCAPPHSRYTRIPWTPIWFLRLLRNLIFYANYFRQWSPTQRREFFRWKWSRLQRRVARWRQPAADQVQVGDLVDLSSYNEEQRRIWEAHIQALIHFHPQAYRGAVHLFRSPGHPLWCSFDADYGWGDLAQGGVVVTVVPGAHEKILEEPNVAVLARALEKSLGQAQSRRPALALQRSNDRPVQLPRGLEQVPPQAKGPRVEFPAQTNYAQQFQLRAERTPAAVAVRGEGMELTYAELNARANQLARRLRELGVGPEDLVAICLERSPDLMIALLAVFKAGGAYLPLDPDYPTERLDHMLGDSQATLLLSKKKLLAGLCLKHGRIFCLDDAQERRRIEAHPTGSLACPATADNLAYVIYTSGSTGTPKGVEITHRALLNHNFAVIQAFELQRYDRVLQFTPLSFDISVEEIFPTWLSGATVVLRPEDLISSAERFMEFLNREAVSVLNLPTAYWAELAGQLGSHGATLPSSVRLVVIGGERAPEAAYREWKQRVGRAVTLINGYGATEATVTSTIHRARGDEESLPIGLPLANTQAVILDEQLKPVPAGVEGELYLGGAGLARGYLRRPELTEARFIANPFPEEIASDRLYRTGDVARYGSDGALQFIGRVDEQIKLRGYRIELGEIEAALRRHPQVKEAAVLVREDAPGQKRLVGYIVGRGGAAVAVESLTGFLKGKLPAYMLPATFVELPVLPLTPAGKIDRRALPAPSATRQGLSRDFVPARTPLEQVLSDLWAEVLNSSPIGLHDNFFDLGGHSLLALRIISRIRDTMQVRLTLRDILTRPSIAELAAYLARTGTATAPVVPLSALGSATQVPLSARQRRIWVLEQFHPHESPYNRAWCLQLQGPLQVPALEKSLTELARRHEALRAIFPAASGTPVQCICEPEQILLPQVDLTNKPAAERGIAADALAQQEARRPYIASHPMLRPLLMRLGAEEHRLLLVLHEIVADSHAVRLLFDELPALYEGFASAHPPSLRPPRARYAEAAATDSGLSAEQEREELAYWTQQLAGLPPLLELPADRPRPPESSSEGVRCSLSIPPHLVSRLEDLSRTTGTSLFSIVLTGLAAVLHRYTGSVDIPIGSLVSRRIRPELQEVIANFENPVALRCDLAGDPSFETAFKRIHQTIQQAWAFSDLPFSNVVEALPLKPNASYTPIFQVMLVLEDQPMPQRQAAGVDFVPVEIDKHTAKYDLTLRLTRTAEGLSGWVGYSTALFNQDRIERFIAHLEQLLTAGAAEPECLISQLPLLPPEERRKLLTDWQGPMLEYPRTGSLGELFQQQVARTPHSLALISGTTRITYDELLARAMAIAASLRERGIAREELVGVCLHRCPDMIAAILGIILAGGAYVPLDPGYPGERLAFILQDARVKVLLTEMPLLGRLPPTDAQVVCVDCLELHPGSADRPAIAPIGPHQLAYVIYTSGSTGRPKGVALEHRSAVAFVHWARALFTDEELSGVLAATSICFDLSVFEIFVPLCWGGTMILADNALALPDLPAAGAVKLINTVPSAIRELLRIKGIPASVRVINLAGEPLPPALVDQLYAETNAAKVYDLYGPTETTTYSTVALRQPATSATIGRPLANEQVFILDPHLNLAPIGVAGELFIGGEGLAREYLNRPELTAEKFILHPFHARARLYRTGDLARWRADGTLEYLGRLDHQVKIRGFRIELGEIESVLKSHPGVAEALVLAREDQPGEKRLVAYVVTPGNETPSPSALRETASARLPDYMLPASFVFLKTLPLTPNGKVDRKALPAPEREGPRRPACEFVGPRNELEEQVAVIWREILSLDQIGVTDNFFELGGHSLLATRVVSAIREVFKVDLPLSALFTAPTIAALAQGLASGQWTQNQSPVFPLKPMPRAGRNPVSFVQERLWFLHQLEPDSHAYNVPAAFRLRGRLDVAALERAFNELVARHEALRTTLQFRDNELSQVIAPTLTLELKRLDLPSAPRESTEEQARAWINAQAQHPFDLERGPLLRAGLVRLGATEHLLLLVLHHTICDGWSLAILFQELQMLYDALASGASAPKLADLPVQYVDFVHWHRQLLQGPILEALRSYWTKQLGGAPASTDLPADFDAQSETPRKAARRALLLEPGLLAALTDLGHRENATPFMVLMAALAITLRKWTGQTDLVIGTVVAGRTRKELEGVVGCFMNFLPIRARVLGSESGQQILRELRTTILEGQTNQDYPFEKIVEAVNPERRLNQNPLYNVALLFQNFPEEMFRSGALQTSPEPVTMESPLLDLRFEAENAPDGLQITCEYRTDLFRPQTVDQVLASLRQVLSGIAGDLKTAADSLKITPELEAQSTAARSRKQQPKLTINATFTAEPLAEPLQYWMRELGLVPQIEFGPYNQVFQQLLDPGSAMVKNSAGLNVVLLRLQDWLPQFSGSQAACAEAEERLRITGAEFTAALKGAAARTTTPSLICFCPASKAAAAHSRLASILAAVEEAVAAELEPQAGIHVLRSRELARWYPVADYDDPSSEELGHVPYTPLFYTALATAVARAFHLLNRTPYKVIVLDCDQTLWTGVCGEDGCHGIRLEPPRLALQEFMRRQLEAGMLLCLCSKNNPEDVLDVFTARLEMPLHREHFAAMRLNWLPKSQNIKSLAQELQLGLDSFILVDDNPIECAEVEANCPEVLALQLPEDPKIIPLFLEHCWAFDHLKLTAEDRQRNHLYRQNQQREQLRAQSASLADFISGLDLTVRIEPAKADELARVAQLTQRTNQFNCTGYRFAEGQVGQCLRDAQVFSVHVTDRFGDYGLTGVLVCQHKDAALDVTTFLLSCRVLGRGVEHRMLARLGELARERKAGYVDVHYVRTGRNKPALDFLESVGGGFKQALNGGYVFRFPAGFAAEVTFQPPLTPEPAGGPQKDPAATPATLPRRKFGKYRAIALQANDPAKIHRQIENKVELRTRTARPYAAPHNELQRQLCELWQNLLRVDRVGVQDNFFEFGGHSLLAVRLFAEIEKLTGRKFPLVTIFQAPTVEELAAALSRGGDSSANSLLVPIQPNGAKPPLFLVHGAGGDVLWGYANLAQHLPSDQPVFGVKSLGQIGLEEPTTLEEMAAVYVKAIRALQPQGPYYLGGYCFGGNVAYEMARQLRRQGEQIGLVLLLDSAPSNAGYERMRWWQPSFSCRFARNFSYWLADFMALEPRDRTRFVSRKLRSAARKFHRRIAARNGAPEVDLEEVIDPSHFPESELKLWQIHLQALVQHVEQAYAGDVILLRTRGQPLFCSLEEDFCWGKLARGRVVVKLVPGSHENVFMQPNVQVLAREVRALLEQFQAAQSAGARPRMEVAPG